MNAIASVFARAANNPHTSIAGLVWMACKLGAIWLPQYKSQFDATEAVAVGYGLFLAGDAKRSAPADSSGQTAATPVKPPTP